MGIETPGSQLVWGGAGVPAALRIRLPADRAVSKSGRERTE